ncbi:HTTM domain-containing protein [Aeromicrobium sp.]|uniref:HTTM domain-containing protein n=1 Tax=Aeromicrobium sp. TaxID=1871063 RepID=UPI003D6B2057
MRWLFEDKHALHGSAAARILSGCAVLGLLVSNIRSRDIVFGPGAVWARPVQDGRVDNTPNYWSPDLVAHLGSTTFLLYYLAIIVLALLWTLGWRTRIVGLLMLVGVVSIVERAPVVGDQGDNILRVGLVLLLFMQADEHWSLDARRRASRGGGRARLPLWFTNGVHNVALAALACQVILVYFWAGMAKARGDLWQHGTALYYPLQLQEFRPFPLLSDLFTHSGSVVGIATYVVMIVQLGFGFALLHPVSRRIVIGLAILLHLSIAVLMALPWFSLSMLAFDAIFVSTTTYVAFERWLRRRGSALVGRDHASQASAGEHEQDRRDGQRSGGRGERPVSLPGDDEAGEEPAERTREVQGQVAEALDRRTDARLDRGAEQRGTGDD